MVSGLPVDNLIDVIDLNEVAGPMPVDLKSTAKITAIIKLTLIPYTMPSSDLLVEGYKH